MVEKFMIKKSGIERSRVEKSGVEMSWVEKFINSWLKSRGLTKSLLKSPGLKLGVEKFGVEMSFNQFLDLFKKLFIKYH